MHIVFYLVAVIFHVFDLIHCIMLLTRIICLHFLQCNNQVNKENNFEYQSNCASKNSSYFLIGEEEEKWCYKIILALN
jgi:hypothetical protein